MSSTGLVEPGTFLMEHDEGVCPASVPEFGAIFMSSYARRKESFTRKLLGLPSAQEVFVKRVKSGMILFLFGFEKRELYGVYRACSDGAMDIVPHAFSSSGKQFPAQVRFTVIWNCNPLSEYEFRDAISENYYSHKKFTFGLSEDQVRRLLWLFSSRKSENRDRVPRRQLGERILGNEKSSLRHRVGKSVEEGSLTHTLKIGNSPSDSQRPDNKRFAETSFGYDALTEHEGISLGGRKFVSENSINLMEDKLEFDYGVRIGYNSLISNVNSRDSLYSLRRQSKENQFIFRDTSETDDIRNVLTCLNPGDSLARTRGDLNDGRVQMRDIRRDSHIPSDDVFLLGKRAESFEIPQTELRRPIDDQRLLFMDREVHYDGTSVGDPRPIIYADHISNSLAKVRRISNDDQIHIGDRTDIGRSVENGISPIVFDGLPLSMGFADLNYQPRPEQSSFSPSKPILEAHYSLSQNQPKASPLFPRSMGQSMCGTYYPTSLAMENNNCGLSYPISRDFVLTRSVPYDPDFPEVNDTSHSVHDSHRYHSCVENEFSTSIKPSCCTEYEVLNPQSDGAFRGVSGVLMPDNQDLYDHFDGRIDNYSLSGGYLRTMEQPSITDEIYEDQQPFSKTPIYVRGNISPPIDFNEPALASQDGIYHKFLPHATDPAISDHQDRMVNYGMERVHSASSFEKFNVYDIESYQDQDGMPTYSGNRTSVFSRLSTSSRKRGQEQEDYMKYGVMDESVDKVMENLFGCLGQKMTDASKDSPFGKQHNTEDTTKRREKRFNQIEADEQTKMTRKMDMECRLAIKEEKNVDDAARETRVVEFKRRSDTKRSLTGEKRICFIGSALDPETYSCVQKPEGEREEGEMEVKQLKRRKLVRPVFGKKEDLNDGSKGDTCSHSQLTYETSSCNKVNCDFSDRSLGNPSPNSRVHKKLVSPAFDKKEELNDNTKRDGVYHLCHHESSSCIKVRCDFSGTSLGNASPKSRVRRKLVIPVCDKKEELNDNAKRGGLSDLANHVILNNQKPATSEASGKTLGNLNSQLTHESSSCNKSSSDFLDTSLINPSPNSRVHKKLVRPVFDRKEESNDNTKRDGVPDLLAFESLDNQKPATSELSDKTHGNPNCLSPNSGFLGLYPSAGSGLLEKVELSDTVQTLNKF